MTTQIQWLPEPPQRPEGIDFKEDLILSPRVTQCVFSNGEAWTTNIGFFTQEQAFKWLKFLQEHNQASHAILRRRQRVSKDFNWELKVWNLNPALLQHLLKESN